MPLDRANVTIASRVMLPAYAILNAVFAATFIIDPDNRLQLAPSLAAARDYMPIDRWGLLWFALAALMVMALLIRHRRTFVVVLAINVAAWAAWGLVVEAAVVDQPNVSLLAGALPVFVAAASFASMLSLLRTER